MKRILAPILLMVFLFPSLALSEEVTWDDLVEREGLIYKKFTDVPFTGKTTGQVQVSFKNGQKDGPWVFYYPNGQLKEKGDYKNGEREGSWVEYYEHGQLRDKGDYKNGEKEGPRVSYWDNGQVFEKGDFKNGKREGPWVSYWQNGQLEMKGDYKNGVMVD